MTALASVTIDRSGLSKSDLVIDSEGFNTYYIDKAGLGRVGVSRRETFATDSPFVDGRMRIAVVKEESSLPLVIRVQSTTSNALDAALDDLDEALSQFVYTVTVEVDGVSKVWTAYPATWNSTDALIAYERVTDFHEDLTITIPVYPVSA